MTKNTQPFGFQMHNGLNLSKSVSNPKSRLARMVNYIRQNGECTRAELAMKALGSRFDATYHREQRGWNGYAFSGAIRGGFLVTNRVGNEVFYMLGPKSHLVTK
jgi:hypothetical protein